jgi:hypothetical protein
MFCGIDVSAATLVVAVIDPDQTHQQRDAGWHQFVRNFWIILFFAHPELL